MQANVGDRILVESETVGTPTREGQVLEVMQGEVGVRYRVRWDDGHESVFTPSAGSVRFVPKAPAKKAPKQPARKPAARKQPAKK
jgi:Domain of unknown function (DUF1918)